MTLPRFTPEGDRVIAIASQRSNELGQHYLGVEHLFLALVEVERAHMARAFASAGADLSRFASELRRRVGERTEDATELVDHITPRCNVVLALADRSASRLGDSAVSARQILAAILSEGRSVPMRLMSAMDLDVRSIEEALQSTPAEAKTSTSTPTLDKFARDLTQLARRGKLAQVIGRKEEMNLLSQVLLRKNKNNPVLVGEPGVGKTAVVEGFAEYLLSETCPEPLRGRRVLELSLATLVAGTKFRGEFEERLTEITKEVAANPEIVLFLDELHSLVGAGSTGGGESLDAANIFKPALARGEMSCIGATTIAEYRRYIEKDPALERRFERIMVEEPTPDEALEILRRVKPSLEKHHELTISDSAIEAAVELTVRHVFDRRLPDKALDALDQSCARRRLARYHEDSAENAGDEVVGRIDVETTVSQWTGIPLARLSGQAARDLLSLQEELANKVLGQDEAVRSVSRTILTAKAGLNDPNRPLGVFFFAGPTGVGKTFLAKSLAEQLFGDDRHLIRIDMSEYQQEHSVSNLIGAPPGYVGHEKEGLLISALRTHPHSVVLFDEVEKAHPKVFDIFLQIFDEGRLTGTHGKVANFRQSVVILTSNLDVRPVQPRRVGFDAGDVPTEMPDARDVLLANLRPELVNRIDEVVAFEPLTGGALRRIVDGYVAELTLRLKERQVTLELSPEVYDHILDMADTDTYGARDLRRLVDRHLRQPLAEKVLELGGERIRIRVTLREQDLRFESVSEETLA